MPPHPSHPSPRRRPLIRLALVAAGVTLAALATVDHRAGERRRAELDEIVADLELPPEAAAALPGIAREDDPTRRALALARALVGAELPVARTGDGARAAIERLEVARELAGGALAARPAAWEAPLLLGAATYLGWSRAADPRLVTEAPAWELPLARARELAPTASEPARFSAIAYLELWPVLSADKQRLARELLTRAFRDGPTRSRLLGVWIDLVEDRDEALAVLPDVPEAWQQAERELAGRGDWTNAIEARRRGRLVLAATLEQRLDQAALERRRQPEPAHRSYLQAIAEAPTDTLFAPLVERALSEAPPGPPLPAAAPGARAWLEWALDLELTGHPPLAPRLVERLAGLAGELPAPTAARAALAADRPERARRIERNAGVTATGAPWAPYWLAKARHLVEQGAPEQARGALERVDAAWRRGPLHSFLDARIAATSGDEALAAAARRRLAATADEIEPRLPLSRADRSASFALFTSGAAGALVLEIGEGDPASLLEVALDGRLLEVVRGRPGRRIEIAAEVDPGLHLVAVTAATGGGSQIRRLAALP